MAGAKSSGEFEIRSVAAVHQAPARSPGSGDQAAHIAAAIASGVDRTADEKSGSTPAAVKTAMPAAVVPTSTVTVPSARRSGGRRQRGDADSGDGGKCKSKFA